MNKQPYWNRVVTYWWLLGLMLSGCNAILPTTTATTAPAPAPTLALTPTVQGVELPFETVERADLPGTGGEYQGITPSLLIITRSEDVSSLGDTISLSAQDELHKLEFDQYFAIAVFQGKKGSNMYGVDIQRVIRDENRITVYTHFTERDPQREAGPVVTSPYHIVKVSREGLQGNFDFFLNGDGEVILKVSATL